MTGRTRTGKACQGCARSEAWLAGLTAEDHGIEEGQREVAAGTGWTDEPGLSDNVFEVWEMHEAAGNEGAGNLMSRRGSQRFRSDLKNGRENGEIFAMVSRIVNAPAGWRSSGFIRAIGRAALAGPTARRIDGLDPLSTVLVNTEDKEPRGEAGKNLRAQNEKRPRSRHDRFLHTAQCNTRRIELQGPRPGHLTACSSSRTTRSHPVFRLERR